MPTTLDLNGLKQKAPKLHRDAVRTKVTVLNVTTKWQSQSESY